MIYYRQFRVDDSVFGQPNPIKIIEESFLNTLASLKHDIISDNKKFDRKRIKKETMPRVGNYTEFKITYDDGE